MANARLRRRLSQALLLTPASPRRGVQFVVTTWALALGGIWVAQQVQAGPPERRELPPLLHLLRDAALAVPFAAIALSLGGLMAGEVLRVADRPAGGLIGRVLWAAVAALVFVALSVPGIEMHSILFGTEEEGELLAELAGGTGLMLTASIAILLPIALTRLAPWPPAEEAESPLPPRLAGLLARTRIGL